MLEIWLFTVSWCVSRVLISSVVQLGYTVALTIFVTRSTIVSTALDTVLETEMEEEMEEEEVVWLEITLDPAEITLSM